MLEMYRLFIVLALVILASCKNKSNNSSPELASYPVTGSIERISEELDAIISSEAKIEIIADGFQWTEGPLWLENEGQLLFSEIPSNSIYSWSEFQGVKLYLTPSGYTGEAQRGGEPGSNGLLLDANRALILCQHGDRRIARMVSTMNTPESKFETVIDNFEGKRFNSPNDACYDNKGNLYFTDPPYGLIKQMEDPGKELDFQGVYRFSATGELTLLTKTMSRPNGIGLSPDNKTLYVANSDHGSAIWKVFKINEEGNVLSEDVFYDATGTPEPGLPDGLKVDPQGNIWATGPGGVWIFNAQGKLLGKIKTGEATSNCAFNADFSILYMTCDDYVMQLKLKP